MYQNVSMFINKISFAENIWLSNLTSNCDWIKDVIWYTTFRIFHKYFCSFSLFLFNWHSFCGFVSLTLKWMALSREAVKWKIISRFYLFIEWKCKFSTDIFMLLVFFYEMEAAHNDKNLTFNPRKSQKSKHKRRCKPKRGGKKVKFLSLCAASIS